MKRIIFSLILALFLLPLAIGISVDVKPVYQPGETLIAEIKGNIIEPISSEDVRLIKEGTNNPVGFEYDIKRLGDSYFIWGTLPSNPQTTNYTLIIDDISTTSNGVPNKTSIKQKIIINGSIIPYSIKPGFVIAENEFTLNFFLNGDSSQAIQTDFPHAESLVLSPGENEFDFNTNSLFEGFQSFTFGIYKLPFYISKNYNPKLTFTPIFLSSTILISKPHVTFHIRNTGNADLENITLQYDNEIFTLSPQTINLIKVNQTLEINLSVKKTGGIIEETITASTNNLTVELPVKIQFTENESEIIIPMLNNTTSLVKYYCSELNGKSCPSNQECSDQVVESLDIAKCCLASCTAPKKSSYSWIGYLILAVVLVILVIIGGKYLKTRKQNKSPSLNSLMKS